jgi:hypothetical protein
VSRKRESNFQEFTKSEELNSKINYSLSNHPNAQSVSLQPARGVSTSTSGLHRESWLWWH